MHDTKYPIFIGIFSVLFLLFQPPLFSQSSIDAEKLKEHVRILSDESMEGRGLGTKGLILAGDYIHDQFESIGLEYLDGNSYEQHFRSLIEGIPIEGRNIIGVLPGKDEELKREAIVVFAHYNHKGYMKIGGSKLVFPGADYNASGVSALLALATHFKQEKNRTDRTLVFVAFDAKHQNDNYGVMHFLKNKTSLNLDLKYGLGVERLGYFDPGEGLRLHALRSLDRGMEIAENSLVGFGFTIDNTHITHAWGTGVFNFSNAGIPAVLASGGRKSIHSQVNDTYEKLQYDNMVMVVEYLAKFVGQLAHRSTDLLPSNRFEPEEFLLDRPLPCHQRKPFQFGIILGAGVGFQKFSDEYFRSRSQFNFTVGLLAHYHFTKSLSLQTEVLFDSNGGNFEGGKYRRNSITAPVNIQWALGNAEYSLTRIYLLGGPYYRYNLGGKLEDDRIDYAVDFRRHEWGLSFGIGIEMNDIYQLKWVMRRSTENVLRSPGTSFTDVNSMFVFGLKF